MLSKQLSLNSQHVIVSTANCECLVVIKKQQIKKKKWMSRQSRCVFLYEVTCV